MDKFSRARSDRVRWEPAASRFNPAAEFPVIIAARLTLGGHVDKSGYVELESQTPPERFPAIGTVEDPALFRDCDRNLLLSYEVAPVDGGGVAILKFNDVVYYEQNPNNVHEGLRKSRYPVRPWEFAEILGSDRTARWSSEYVQRRFWTISFNDWMVEVVFGGVKLVHASAEQIAPDAALLKYLTVPC